eukprot:scaffold677181_cov32-Prasinocladus_malaysianus.AAC.1
MAVNENHNMALEGVLIDEMQRAGLLTRCTARNCAMAAAAVGHPEPRKHTHSPEEQNEAT